MDQQLVLTNIRYWIYTEKNYAEGLKIFRKYSDLYIKEYKEYIAKKEFINYTMFKLGSASLAIQHEFRKLVAPLIRDIIKLTHIIDELQKTNAKDRLTAIENKFYTQYNKIQISRRECYFAIHQLEKITQYGYKEEISGVKASYNAWFDTTIEVLKNEFNNQLDTLQPKVEEPNTIPFKKGENVWFDAAIYGDKNK